MQIAVIHGRGMEPSDLLGLLCGKYMDTHWTSYHMMSLAFEGGMVSADWGKILQNCKLFR